MGEGGGGSPAPRLPRTPIAFRDPRLVATHVSDCSNLSLFLCACAVVPIAVQIADVAVGSPAAQAGVGAGQYVLSINDISISHLDQSAVDKQLAEAGGTVKLITMPGFIYEAQGAVLAKPVVFRLFSGCFSVIEAQGGRCFRTPCNNCRWSRANSGPLPLQSVLTRTRLLRTWPFLGGRGVRIRTPFHDHNARVHHPACHAPPHPHLGIPGARFGPFPAIFTFCCAFLSLGWAVRG